VSACVSPPSTFSPPLPPNRDQLAGNGHFAVHPRKQDEFLITHYAGDVNYSTAGFLDKNKDMLNIGT
jgi:myosin heavy subunit